MTVMTRSAILLAVLSTLASSHRAAVDILVDSLEALEVNESHIEKRAIDQETSLTVDNEVKAAPTSGLEETSQETLRTIHKEADIDVEDVSDTDLRGGAPIGVPGKITAMQWSAHWRCFAKTQFGETCAPKVKELLGNMLANSELNLDFVNLGMFQDYTWQPPTDFGSFEYKCSMDDIKVLYRKTKWRLSGYQTDKQPKEAKKQFKSGKFKKEVKDWQEPEATDVFGCSNLNGDGSADRAYGVFAFKGLDGTPWKNEKVIVVTGHFPHPEGGTSSAPNAVAEATAPLIIKHIAPKIAQIKQAESWKNAKVVFIGDLNNNEEPDVAPRLAAFSDKGKIEAAFDVMDQESKHVKAVKGMTGQIAHENDQGYPKGFEGKFPGMAIGCTLEGNKTVCTKTIEESLKMPNRGYVDQPIMSSADVWAAFQMGATVPLQSVTQPFGTCCADKPAMLGGNVVAFPYTFDRIMASFGPLTTIMPLDGVTDPVTPENAQLIKSLYVGAFHKPIIAVIG